MNAKRLVELEAKLDVSGIKGNPIITDGELSELQKGLRLIADYFQARDEPTIFMGVHLNACSVESVINARKRS